MSVHFDGERLLARLSELATSARSPDGSSGVTRLAWSVEDLAARSLLGGWVATPGVVVTIDPVGNVIADWAGSVEGLAPIVVGSHVDTVINGGPLDGAYGTVTAFEIVAALAAGGERLRHPVRSVAWANEEGIVAPPFTGSRAVSGEGVDVHAVGPGGRSLGRLLIDAGDDPAAVETMGWPPVAGYLELHIEQGPVLHDAGISIGVVTAITGSRRGIVSVTGRANHAGTTPMDLRCDALVAAAPLVARIRELATVGPADVATVGSLVVEPGVGNVVPGRVLVGYDIRSIHDDACEQAVTQLSLEVNGIAAATGATVTLTPTSSTPAINTASIMRSAIADAASDLGLSWTEIPSGAGHDAQHLASLGPMGMIFVPSVDGVSHHPAETTPPDQLVAGAETLLATLRLVDERLDP